MVSLFWGKTVEEKGTRVERRFLGADCPDSGVGIWYSNESAMICACKYKLHFVHAFFSGNVTLKLTFSCGDNLARDPPVGMPTLSLGVDGGLLYLGQVLEGVLALPWCGGLLSWSSKCCMVLEPPTL